MHIARTHMHIGIQLVASSSNNLTMRQFEKFLQHLTYTPRHKWCIEIDHQNDVCRTELYLADYWLGLCKKTATIWSSTYWLDGTESLFRYWYSNEPNENTQCIRLAYVDAATYYRDIDCYKLYRFICKKPAGDEDLWHHDTQNTYFIFALFRLGLITTLRIKYILIVISSITIMHYCKIPMLFSRPPISYDPPKTFGVFSTRRHTFWHYSCSMYHGHADTASLCRWFS